MKNICCLILASFFSFLILSCNPKADYKNAEETINGNDITRIVKEFGSDAFQGRKPFTAGEDSAVNFLIREYKRIGLEPANNGSYLQEVPMVEITDLPDDKMIINVNKQSLELLYKTDFVAFSKQLVNEINLENSEIVFAGYGIVAPEYNWNDYEGIDVKGKTIVVFVNDPSFGTNQEDFFKGNAMTYYGRWTYKYEEAARQGAKGILIVHETEPAGYPWSVVLNGATIPKLYLQPEDNYMSMCAVEGWITLDAAKKLFSLAGYDLNELKEQAKKKGFKPFLLNAQLNFSMHSDHRFATSKNVLGILPGTDRADEIIVYSSHWDHLGIGTTLNGDSIYNGAVDNGTTTAWMLEIAEAFTNLKNRPSRSILIFSPTSEEQGLLGSEYYAEHPVFPLNKTVANINNDLMLPYGRHKDIMITGYGQSELDDYLKKIAPEYDRYIMPDPNPHTGMYYRADHFSFAKVGVPALFARGNCDSREHGKECALKMEKDWLTHFYHKPADQYDSSTWDLSGIVDDAKILFRLGFELANDTVFPKWKDGSEFKELRKQQ
ncbi:MAG: peptidase M28 [Bacteroidetes bacterium GWC2_33_15]|nr:MAG: peptidase M28 [Bacteroidetes bacterium GWA2_33_15]OFX52573.1 MAG: peptidase M28 [Bacteroidetes bacterium GWC2_33_15]OFX63918.1 MAG: peptidase M28 [Bacteroidetes bacterium GWB2_32_14]OFX70815.1 MAG: peptidase M28 [Bacteroidetes bacterium GWD2_33_33]HAN19943.1 peptidase M28 [Bacteroidales bacterium]